MNSNYQVPAVIQQAAKEQQLQINQDKVNLILPTRTFGEIIGKYDKVCLEMVSVSPDKNEGDVYEISGKKAFTKTTLMKFADGLAIQWDPKQTYTEELSKAKIRGKATGAMRKPNGEWIIRSAEKVIDLDVVREELEIKYQEEALKGNHDKVLEWGTSKYGKKYPKKLAPWSSTEEEEKWISLQVKKALLQKQKFAHELADTGAKDRVIREFLALKSSYTDVELSKPFVFPRVVIDTQKMLEFDDTRKAAIDRMVGAAGTIFGNGSEGPRNVTPKDSLPSPDDQEEDPIEAESQAVDDPFSDEPEEEVNEEEADPREELKQSLEEWLSVDSLSENSRKKIAEAIENPEITEEELREMLDKIKKYFEKKEAAS